MTKFRNRKILIHTRSLNIPGGKQTFLMALDGYFKNEVTYFYYGTLEPKKESRFQFVKRFFKNYLDFYRVLKKENFDLVHINTSFNFKSFFRDSLFTLIASILNRKILVYWHGWNSDFEKRIASKVKPYFHFTFGKADAMVCLANEFSDSLRLFNYLKPIYVETTVVEDFIFKTADQRIKPQKDFSILFLSRIEKEKGIYTTMESFSILKTQYPNLKLLVAGVGSELKPAMDYVKEKSIEGIEFLGWIEGEAKANLLNSSEIFVLPSYHGEGMPICILEAMAVGLPIITTDLGAVKDFFQEGKMGYKVEPKDSEGLSSKIEAILKNPFLREEIGNFNKHYAKERFMPEIVCGRLEMIYENTIT